MRDYPSFPNVFRVASSHSVSIDGGGGGNGSDKGAASGGVVIGTNSNDLTMDQQAQQQQQRQQQQQQLKHSLSTASTSSAAAAATATAVSGSSHGHQEQQQQQQQQLTINYHNGNSNNDSHNINNNSNNKGHANGGTSGRSPYATLPRSISAIGNGDVRRLQQQPQPLPQQHQQTPQQQRNNKPQQSKSNSNNSSSGNGNGSNQNGLIHTISGSIPATGFVASSNRSISIASDLNVHSDHNSLTDLRALPLHDRRLRALDANGGRSRGSGGGGGGGGGNQAKAKASTMPAAFVASGHGAGVCANAERNAGGYLWILTPVAASISVAIVIAALAGPQWLYTEEKLPNTNYNGTANFNALDDGAFITKYTKSSLWILCTTLQGVETYNCIKIDYFPKEGYQPDPLDSTPAIPYTVTKSCPFFLASGIFLLISFLVFLVPTCSHQNNLFYFSAGIMFIVSGLLMLIGLIAYISILKAEIGSKLRPRSTLQPALFKVTYGQSFFLFVFGFISTEFVGLLNIFLYISLQEVGYYSRLPCFTIANIQQKIKEGENPRSHTYKSYKHASLGSASVTAAAVPASQSQSGRRPHAHAQPHPPHQVHSRPEPHERDERQLAGFACKKHPTRGSNALLANDLERRFYFEKPPKCDLHSKDLAKDLNELYTEPAPPLAPPPPSVTNGAHGASVVQTLPRQASLFADLPQEFPLTRSVSTTTELYSGGGNGGSGPSNSRGTHNKGQGNGTGHGSGNGSQSQSQSTTTPRPEKKNRRNQATNTRPIDGDADRPERRRLDCGNGDGDGGGVYDEEPEQRLCGLKRGIRKTKDELFHEFCKRAGVRPKPRNIYYVDDGEQAGAEAPRHQTSGHDDDGDGGGGGGVNGVVFEGGLDDDDEENIYIIDDIPHPQVHFVPRPLRHQAQQQQQQRRNSMFVEPPAMRKLSSNLSLHSLYPGEKPYQRSLLDLDRCDSAADMWPSQPPQPHLLPPLLFADRSPYGGSQSRLHQSQTQPQPQPDVYSNGSSYRGSQQQLHQQQQHPYQSRTLPRSFLKRSADSQDSLSVGHGVYVTLQQQQQQQQERQLHQQQQRQLQQQRYLSLSRDAGVYSSSLALHKSCEDVAVHHAPPPRSTRLGVGHGVGVGGVGVGSQQQLAVQWPAAIPTSPSPSNYAASSFMYAPPPLAHHQQQHQQQPPPQPQHALVTRSVSGGPTHKFQRAYAFDEQRRASAVFGDAFDLDEMERERRRSHASLFGSGPNVGGGGSAGSERYDLINGTAV